MNIKRLALLTFAATALATAALADGPSGGHGGFLKSADLNKDGVIDQTEFQATRDKWFADLDANKDGFVTADELKAFGDKMHAEWAKKHADQAANDAGNKPADGKHGDFSQRILERVDTDKDGKISKAEFDAEGSKLFAKFDQNGDGKIASNEMPQRHLGQVRRPDVRPHGRRSRRQGDQGRVEAAGEKMFQRMDKNGDGTIEKNEMQMPHGNGEPAPNP